MKISGINTATRVKSNAQTRSNCAQNRNYNFAAPVFTGNSAAQCDMLTFCGRDTVKSEKSVLMDALKYSLRPIVKKKDVSGILHGLGYDIKTDKNGFITINGDYNSQNAFGGISFGELGIDENMIFEKVKHIKGSCLLSSKRELKSSGALESVGGSLHAQNVKEFTNLQHIGGNACFVDDVADYSIKSPLIVDGTAYFCESLNSISDMKPDPSVNVKAREIVYLTL